MLRMKKSYSKRSSSRLVVPPEIPPTAWRGSISCMCFCQALLQDKLLWVCARVTMLYLLWRQPAGVICFCLVSCRVGQSSSALSSAYALTGWWVLGGKRKQLGSVLPSISFELTLFSPHCWVL